jgi:hypothetical protein
MNIYFTGSFKEVANRLRYDESGEGIGSIAAALETAEAFLFAYKTWDSFSATMLLPERTN